MSDVITMLLDAFAGSFPCSCGDTIDGGGSDIGNEMLFALVSAGGELPPPLPGAERDTVPAAAAAVMLGGGSDMGTAMARR